jgi:hypothetical protein
MAFNPFTSFRKYQKIWMPIILLLCMATFVLCSGSKGDFSEWLLGLFGRREGAAIAKVGGRSVYRKDLYDLKEQRNAVNEFMKRASEFAIKKLNALADSPEIQKMPQGPERTQLLAHLTEYKGRLEARAVRARYFGTGVTLDELVDFKVWLHEADRLGVNLIPEHVKALLNDDLFALAFFREYGYKLFDANERDYTLTILRDMRATSQRVTETMIYKALNDEYRVRIAQKALALSDPYLETDSEQTTRIPLSPAMLWDYFKENRLTFDVSLVPVEVSKFTTKVPEPAEADLQSLFKARAKDRYDPASSDSGFEILPGTRVEMVVGDPSAPAYKLASKVILEMQTVPPVWIPSSPWSVLERYVDGPWAMRQTLEKQYEGITNQKSDFRAEFLTASLTDPDAYFAMAGFLARKYPEAAASWIASYAQPTNMMTGQLSYYAFGAARHPEELRKGLAEEFKVRAPLFAPMIFWGTTGSALDTLGMIGALSAKTELQTEKYLPLDIVRETLTELMERKLAQEWVNANMNLLRSKLDTVVGNKAKFKRELDKYLPGLGLELVQTKDDVFYNRYTIDKAPELKPLLKEYEKWYRPIDIAEGRDMKPETVLKEDDFHKLFFDGTEAFSAFGSTYKAKPWPPLVTPKKVLGEVETGKQTPQTDLFAKAPRPILFWKVEDRPGKIPESLDQVKDRVADAWKTDKARDLALPEAKKLADKLLTSEVGYGPAMAFETPNDVKPIKLKGLAPLYTTPDYFMPLGNRSYSRYKIPANTFDYPRDDMSETLLSLADLKKPIEIGVKNLDEINQELFKNYEKKKKPDDIEGVVQILTNKPRTVFYVACVTFKSNERSKQVVEEFNSVLRYALRSPGLRGATVRDEFVDVAYSDASKTHMRALMQQLYSQTDSEILLPDERKGFDSSDGG